MLFAIIYSSIIVLLVLAATIGYAWYYRKEKNKAESISHDNNLLRNLDAQKWRGGVRYGMGYVKTMEDFKSEKKFIKIP